MMFMIVFEKNKYLDWKNNKEANYYIVDATLCLYCVCDCRVSQETQDQRAYRGLLDYQVQG